MEHLDAIMRIMQRAFDPLYREAWNRRQVSDGLLMPATHALLVDENGTLIDPGETDATRIERAAGFCLSRHVLDEEELLLIAVDPRTRRRGLGKALIRQLAQESARRGCTRLFLEMREGNPAETLYRAHGFLPIGRRRDYYTFSDGQRADAITFGLSLTPTTQENP